MREEFGRSCSWLSRLHLHGAAVFCSNAHLCGVCVLRGGTRTQEKRNTLRDPGSTGPWLHPKQENTWSFPLHLSFSLPGRFLHLNPPSFLVYTANSYSSFKIQSGISFLRVNSFWISPLRSPLSQPPTLHYCNQPQPRPRAHRELQSPRAQSRAHTHQTQS